MSKKKRRSISLSKKNNLNRRYKGKKKNRQRRDQYRGEYHKYNKYANDDGWQNKCVDSIKDVDNVILSSPTGSGKTRVYLEWAKQKGNKPVIITAPIKALANQQYRDLKKAGYTVGLETGDIKSVPEKCDFICCTQEIYTNKYVELEDATLIIDEFHYIFEDKSRTRTYIDALNNSKAKNILLCSATFGDTNKLVEYLKKVSKRDFLSYENEKRLTSLTFEGDIRKENINNALVVTFSRTNIEKILQELKLKRKEKNKNEEKIMKLVNKRKIDNKDIINNAKKGLAGYYGALLPKEKMFIEECFEKKLIDTVVGTDALALGVNFPVEKVVFTQFTKINNDGEKVPISKNMFDQLCGRAGRKNFYDKGKVYYCSDFEGMTERTDFKMNELYLMMLEKENENMNIELTPNIKKLLLGETTIKEEVDFISKFSTKEINEKEKYIEIKDDIDYILHRGYKEQSRKLLNELKVGSNKEKYRQNLLAKEEEYIENISDVYFDEYTPEINCKIFTTILSGKNPKDIIDQLLEEGTFYDILQFRKYVKSLPRKYRKGLTGIDDIIRDIDDTALDGYYKGELKTKDIVKQCQKEGKYNNENVEKTLDDLGKDVKESEEVINNKKGDNIQIGE